MAKPTSEEKYKLACQRTRFNFPETLKQAKFKPLLTALLNDTIPAVVGVEILREGVDVRIGSLTTELPLPKAPTQIFCGSGLIGPEIMHRKKFCLVPGSYGATVVAIIHKPMDLSSSWAISFVPRESRILLGLAQTIELPYDMRLWDSQHGKELLSYYLKITTDHLRGTSNPISSLERTNAFVNNPGAGKLVRIRQLNLQPGKQKKTKLASLKQVKPARQETNRPVPDVEDIEDVWPSQKLPPSDGPLRWVPSTQTKNYTREFMGTFQGTFKTTVTKPSTAAPSSGTELAPELKPQWIVVPEE